MSGWKTIPRSLLSISIVLAGLLFTTTAFADSATLKVSAGVGSGTVAGDVYGPGEFTVHVGDNVAWSIASDEPHTITFGQGPANVPPPGWPVAGFKAPPPGPPGPVNLGSTDFDGSAFVNTGLIYKGSTATVHFTKAGDFSFFCAIHPGMAGVVHVVSADQSATSQADADAKAQATANQILGQVDALRKQGLAKESTTRRADGTTQWNIQTNAVQKPGPQPGGGTGYLEILEFMPATLSIAAGDTVHWTATAPHTVTFLPPGTNPASLGDPLEVPPAKPSNSYDGKSQYNSGVFLLGPNAPSDFSLTFPQPGSYSYLCLLHAPLGQVGTIKVSARSALPPALPRSGGLPEWLAGALLLGGVTFVGLGTFALRAGRRSSAL